VNIFIADAFHSVIKAINSQELINKIKIFFSVRAAEEAIIFQNGCTGFLYAIRNKNLNRKMCFVIRFNSEN